MTRPLFAADLVTGGSNGYHPRRTARLPALVAVVGLHLVVGAGLFRVLAVARTAPLPIAPLTVELIALPPSPPPAPPQPEQKDAAPARAAIVLPRPVVPLPQAPRLTTTFKPAPIGTSETPSLSEAAVRPGLSASTSPSAPSVAPTPTSAPTPAPTRALVVPPDAFASGLNNPAPRYPLESRRLREQGTVVLAVEVTADGIVASIAVARSSGHRRLDRAARDTVRTWRFKPATQAGQSVAAQGIVEIPFVLTRR